MPFIETENKLELAKLHLDRFWHEIFWRRENEQKVSVWTISSLAAILAIVYGLEQSPTKPQKLVLAFLLIILGGLAAWYLYQNWRKDKEIARLIVKLNKALGAWEENYLVEGEPLYPKKWDKLGIEPEEPLRYYFRAFRRDYVSFFYFLIVIIATIASVVGIFFK